MLLAAAGLVHSDAAASAPIEPGWVAIDAGVVTDWGTGLAPAGAADLGDVLLTPGSVDLQVNGVGPDDFATAGPEGWRRARAALLAAGTTSFCPTICTAPLSRYGPALARVAAARARDGGIIGAHLEGPFLGGAPGAHPADLIRPVDLVWLVELLDRFAGVVRIMTLAPEADPGFDGISALASRGVVAALGHSTATYDEAVAGAEAGATLVTHLFNGMSGVHHRDPGLASAALDLDTLTSSIIADLVHVHPSALRLAFARKANLVLVSDAVSTAGDVIERDGAVWLEDDTLTGAVTLLDGAIRNVVRLGVPLRRAVAAASTEPGRLLGLATYGAVGLGGRADLVALDPATLDVRTVWVGGEVAYAA